MYICILKLKTNSMKRYLDKEQIKALEENGLKTKNNSNFMYSDILMQNPCIGANELLVLLNFKIEGYCFGLRKGEDGRYFVFYDDIYDDKFVEFHSINLVDALFLLLLWCVEYKYIKL